MDLSPKLLTDVQFREQWRGYNPEEVDEFLERVAAGVGEMQHRLNDAVERASNAERRLLERSDDDEIRRTLVLAQRTAAASVEEARAEADRLVTETDARCRALVAEAEAEAARLDSEITTRRESELHNLAEERAALQDDIEVLQRFVDSERTRLANMLRHHLESFEHGYVMGDAPEVSDPAPAPVITRAPARLRARDDVDVTPTPVVAEVDDDDDEVDIDEVDIDEVDESPAADESGVDELRQAREELADALRRAGVEPLPLAPDAGDEEAGAPIEAYDPLGEEPDEPLWRDEADDDDPFLAELRRAVVDTEPLGPRDHVVPPDQGDFDDEVPSGGFLRRRRRG